MGTDTESKVAEINKRLKANKYGVSLWLRGDKLSLRAKLPPKPGKDSTQWVNQTIALDIRANPAGLKRAEAEAKKLSSAIALKEFRWADYLKSGAESGLTVGELIQAFEKDYFSRNKRDAKTETTWRTEYALVFRKLPADQEISASLLLDKVEKTNPDSRTRKRYCMVLGALAKFAGLELDLSGLAGDYSPSKVTPRNLPSDADIQEWYGRIENPQWRYVFALMATYGLRNHEVFHLDLESLKHSHILTVNDGKTGRRRVWACYPEWYEMWDLAHTELPLVTGKDNSALGGRVTNALKRYGFLKPYNLRHAWAVRTLEFGLPTELAAAQMGHSHLVHTQTYHHWITDATHQRAYDIAMNRPDRPKPPGI